MWGSRWGSRSLESDGRYHFVRQLSEDPIGALWVAENVDTGTMVTLRVLRDDLVADERFARWLRLELRPVSLLQHPNILDVSSANGGSDGQIRFVVMSAFGGESLAQRIRRVGPLGRSEATAIAAQIQEGLDAAHEIGLVHGGVSAHNVLLTEEDGVKLIDFGIPTALWLAARHAHRLPKGTSSGSVPELTGREPDRAHDAHSLEVLMQHMISGDQPTDEDELPTLVQLVLEDEGAAGPGAAPSPERNLVDRVSARPVAFAAVIVVLAVAATVAFVSTRPSSDRSAEQLGPSPSPSATALPSSPALGVAVPDVDGLSAMEAQDLLVTKGLVVADAKPTPGPPGVVVGTDPPTSQVVKPGTPITLLVGATPERLDGS
jgi:serine/threonine-protein kinase